MNQKPEAKRAVFKEVNPVLPCADMARDVAFYQKKLGFKKVFDSTDYEEGPLTYAVLCRDDLCLHLQCQGPEDMTQTQMPHLRFVIKNLAVLFEEYKRQGLTNDLRQNTPWGTNEFAFYDLNGNGLTFYEDVSNGLAFAKS